MREELLDIIEHTYDLKLLDKVLVTSDDKETVIQSMDAGRSIVMKGTLNAPIEDLKGQFGMGNLDQLKGLCLSTSFKTDDSKITVKRKSQGSETFPEQFIFSGPNAKMNYRCMLASAIDPQPNFRGSEWDVDITLAKGSIIEFSDLCNIMKSEQFMYVELDEKTLKFYIGSPDSSENGGMVEMAHNVSGELKNIFQWKIQHFLSICRLAKGDVSLRILSRGLINISMDSDYGSYEYYLPRYIVEEGK